MILLMYIHTNTLQAQDDAPCQTVAADRTITDEVCVVCVTNYYGTCISVDVILLLKYEPKNLIQSNIYS